ncbi:MAG: hypothetical protein KF694_07430 [Mesorhizobium sp.]|nr:hypothetical protein [Mesorhizobium sp.]
MGAGRPFLYRSRSFSTGHDLKEAQRDRQDFTVEQRWEYEQRRYFDYALRIWDCPKPTIARVQGACIAGGFLRHSCPPNAPSSTSHP